MKEEDKKNFQKVFSLANLQIKKLEKIDEGLDKVIQTYNPGKLSDYIRGLDAEAKNDTQKAEAKRNNPK